MHREAVKVSEKGSAAFLSRTAAAAGLDGRVRQPRRRGGRAECLKGAFPVLFNLYTRHTTV